MEARPAWSLKWDLPILAALVAATWLVGARGAPGAGFVFQLGPNDHSYLSGFESHYEVADGVATRWSTYDARINFPFVLKGGPAELSYRFARVYPETAQIEVSLDGNPVDRFEVRGGLVQTRTARLPIVASAPLRIGIIADSHERQNRGLRLDWVRVDAGENGRLRPRGASLWLPPLLSAFWFALFRWGGLSRFYSTLAAGAWLVSVALWLPRDPFGFCHVVRHIGVSAAALSLLAAAILRRFPGGHWAIPVFVLGYLLKASALFYPTTFYPDVANARDYVEVFRETSGSLAERGVATQTLTGVGYPRNVGGKDYAFPYSPLYFLPYGMFSNPGTIEDAVRHGGLTAASLATLPLFWIGLTLFGARAGVLATFAWAFMPPIFSRLLLALHATVVGNFLDLLVIASVLALVLEPESWRRTALVAGTTLASLLVYTSSLFSVSAFFLFAAALHRRLAPRLVAILFAAGTITVVWLYWPFLGAFVTEILPVLLGSGRESGDASAGASSALARIPLFYGYLYPAFAVAGLFIARRRAERAGFRLLVAYALAFTLMLSVRVVGGNVFKDLKEITFVAPLVALLAGTVIDALSRRERWGKFAAALVLAVIAGFGLSRYRGYLETYASPLMAYSVDEDSAMGYKLRNLDTRRTSMKFMVHWSIDQENWLPIMKKWASMTPEERASAGDGVKIIGRWHDTAGRTGVAIVESDDMMAVQRYMGQWNPSMDLDITPVLDDEESAALGQALVEDHGL